MSAQAISAKKELFQNIIPTTFVYERIKNLMRDEKGLRFVSRVLAFFVTCFLMLTPMAHAIEAFMWPFDYVMAYYITHNTSDFASEIVHGETPSDQIDKMVVECYKVFVGTDTSGSEDAKTPWENATNEIYTLFKMLGAMWMLAIAISQIFTNIEKGVDGTQAVYKTLIYIAITGVFIMHLDKIMHILSSLGNILIGFFDTIKVPDTLGGGTKSVDDAAKFLGELIDMPEVSKIDDLPTGLSGLLGGIQAFCMLLIPFILSMAVALVLRIQVLGVIFEIGIRRMFAPLAVVDVFQEGMRSQGARYLKRYFGSFLKLLIFFVIIQIGNVLTANTHMLGSGAVEIADDLAAALGDLMTIHARYIVFILQTLLVSMLEIKMLSTADGYVNDIIGA